MKIHFAKSGERFLKYAPWGVLLIAFLLFARSFGYGPLLRFDDAPYIFDNPNLGLGWEQIKRLGSPVMNLWTPLPMYTYLADFAIGGYDVYSYHIQNTLWHLLAVLMAWRLLRELEVEPAAALVMSLIFAIHPQRVESVVWLSERKDVVTAALFFASLATFVHFRRKGRTFDPWSWLLMLGALFCKQTAVALPAVMFLLEVYRERKWNFKVLFQLWPYYLGVGIYMFIAGMVRPHSAGQVGDSASEPLSALILVARNYLQYAGKMLLPLELNPVYPFFVKTPGAVTVIMLACLAAGAGLLWLWFRKRALLLYEILPPLLVFGGILIPVCGFFPFSSADFADRYSYLPSLFLLLAVFGVLKCFAGKVQVRLCVFALAAYLLYLGAFNFIYQAVWRNDRTFYEAICDVPSPNYRPAFILADLKLKEGDADGALALAAKAGHGTFRAVEQRRSIDVFSRYIRGMAAYQRRDYNTAVTLLFGLVHEGYDTAMFYLSPDAPFRIYLTLAAVSREQGENDKAAFWYDHIAKIYPENRFLCAFYGGMAAMCRGDYPLAEKKFTLAGELNPDDPRWREYLEEARAKRMK